MPGDSNRGAIGLEACLGVRGDSVEKSPCAGSVDRGLRFSSRCSSPATLPSSGGCGAIACRGGTSSERPGALYWEPKRSWNLSVRLAPGIHELQILYHKYWHAGGMRFRSATAAGTPLAWRCDPDFGTMEAP